MEGKNRSRKLTAIAKKVAMFMMTDTWTDEKELQRKLDAALGELNDAVIMLKKVEGI